MSSIYCVLKIKDKQYFVTEGDVLKTHPVDDKDIIRVLLLKDGEKLLLGCPDVKDGGVVINVLGRERIKTDVRRYKSKSRYRKNKSHSQEFSVLRISKISSKLRGVKIDSAKGTSTLDSVEEDRLRLDKVVSNTKSLEEYNFSSRILNALSKNKIKTVNQLSGLSKDQILALEGLGEKSAEIIIKKLGK